MSPGEFSQPFAHRRKSRYREHFQQSSTKPQLDFVQSEVPFFCPFSLWEKVRMREKLA